MNQPNKILLRRYSDYWQAFIEGTTHEAVGRDEVEALGNLVRLHPREFNITTMDYDKKHDLTRLTLVTTKDDGLLARFGRCL